MDDVVSPQRTYVKNRFIYDADSHIVEPPTWLRDYADPAMRDQIPLLWTVGEYKRLVQETGIDPETVGEDIMEALHERHASAEFRDRALENVLVQKQLNAIGAFRADDRKMVLDQLGFQKQLVFNTFSNQVLQEAEAGGNLEKIRAMSRAHNRAIIDFCNQDHRLMAAGYVPLSDLEQADQIAEEAIKMGCAALIVTSACPPKHGPTHVGFEGLWARAAEAGVPIVVHVGGTGEVLNPMINVNGRPRTPDFKGGEGAMTSLRVLALPNPAKTMIAAMVMDGVLMRHPRLRIGVFELGATWLPSFLRELDAVAAGFRLEPRIRDLDLRPSEYVQRQVRVTPYPYEDPAWILEQAGDTVCMFCSDYPHHEGSKDPLGRFDSWLAKAPESTRQRFFVENFVDFTGNRLPSSPVRRAA